MKFRELRKRTGVEKNDIEGIEYCIIENVVILLYQSIVERKQIWG